MSIHRRGGRSCTSVYSRHLYILYITEAQRKSRMERKHCKHCCSEKLRIRILLSASLR